MKRTKILLPLMGCVLALALSITLMPGCEDDADTDIADISDFSTDESQFSPSGAPLKQDFDITPDNPIATSTHFEDEGVPSGLDGDTVQFTASGGTEPYSEWESSASSVGTINQSGLFTYAGGIGETRISVRDAQGRISETTATAQWKEGSLPDLAISPSTISLQTQRIGTNEPAVYNSDNLAGDTLAFVAAGGLAPYSWSMSSTNSFGAFVAGTDSATLTLNGQPSVGTATITVRDSIDQLVIATVTISNP